MRSLVKELRMDPVNSDIPEEAWHGLEETLEKELVTYNSDSRARYLFGVEDNSAGGKELYLREAAIV